MKQKVGLFLAGGLLVLNILLWQQVFYLCNRPRLEVDFFSVGQGDAAFIQTQLGHQILIDGGPNSSVLEKLGKQMPFLDKSIDAVVLTHPESDHMEGLLQVLQRYKVNYFLWSGVVRYSPEYKQLLDVLAKAQKNGTKIIAVNAGQKIKAGKAHLDIIYPLENLNGKALEKTSNDACVVLRLTFGKTSFLFTGDISGDLEKQFVSKNIFYLSDVLKVAHHGSKYSTSDIFLQNLKAKIAVVSVGKDNTYGHPAAEALQRLQNYGIKTLRTDIDGDVRLMSDGNNININ